jgi:limonene-1,2-epoxide hydrolase
LAPRLALAVLLALLPAGCGGGGGSPATVVRAWSRALNAGDDEAAADLFARDAKVIQSGRVLRLRTHAQARDFNRALPCSGRIVGLAIHGDEVKATFVLGDRPSSRCDGPGEEAAAVFRIRGGKIVLWHQVAVPAGSGEATI